MVIEDLKVRQELLKNIEFIPLKFNIDQNEHSVALQFPLLKYIMEQKTNGSFKIVPLLVSSPSTETENDIARILSPYFEDPHTLFIVSSDFCHWGARFQYCPVDSSSNIPIYKFIEKLDKVGMDLIEDLNHDGFKAYLDGSRNTICGRNVILILLNIIAKNQPGKYKMKFCHYQQSSRVTSASHSSVSYAAGLLTKIA